MNQGTAVAGGAGGSGDGDGTAGDGNDKEGAGGGSGGDDASADNKNAPDYEKYPTCGTESHPVDVVTGRVFTHPITDLELPGPLPFTFQRSYSSAACKKEQGLGWGWAHSLGWFIEVERRLVRVWNEKGVSVSFPVPQIGHSVLGDWGWVLRRELTGFAVDANDDVWRIFSTSFDEGKTFRLTAIEDRNKNRIALTYGDGKLVEVKDSAGRIIKITSTKEGQITSLQVKNAEHQGQWIRFARYEYDDKGRLVRVQDADDYAWTYAYDEHNRLVRDTDRAGLSFCFRYDEKDRGIEAWGEYIGKRDPSLADDLPKFLADGRTRAKGIYHRKFDYHKDGYTEVTDTTETRRYFGNKKGLLDKAVTGAAITSSKYDARGFEIEKTDPVGATWRWTRDERGRILEEVDPLGHRITYERDAYGFIVRTVDQSGGVATAVRDQRGNPLLITDAAGGVEQMSFDERGLITMVVEPNGESTRYVYDAHGNNVEIIQSNGGIWRMSYDAFARVLSTTDPLSVPETCSYSDRGDLLATYDRDGGVTRYSYDGEHHLVQVADAKGHITQLVWGGFHKLCLRRDALGHAVRLAYDREGMLVAVVNEREEIHRLQYDSAGRLVAEHTLDGRTLRYRHDLAGRVVRVENGAGEVTELQYNLVGAVVGRKLPDNTEEVFEYDARGELVASQNAACELSFQRDGLGRILRETQSADGHEHWVQIEYDAAGNRVSTATSLGHVEQIQRGALGARVTTWLDGQKLTHENDLLARELRRTLPAGGVIESAFDRVGNIATRSLFSPSPRAQRKPDEPAWIGRIADGITSSTSYQYDLNAKLIAELDGERGPTRYDYDPIGQLVAVVPAKARAAVFRYDPAGNLSDADTDSVYGPGNRLLRKGDTEYLWDRDGRLREKRERTRADGERVWTYTWNGAGLLSGVETPEGRRVEFTYDSLARRLTTHTSLREGIARKVAEHVRFVWDGNAMAHELRRAFGAAGDPVVEERTYLFDDDDFEPLADRLGTAPWRHYVTDRRGAPRRLADASGNVIESVDMDVWGYSTTSTTPIRLQGQYADTDTGLSYNRFRYYAPDTGLYISPDPIGLLEGTQFYGYTNDPVSIVDPFGLSKRTDYMGKTPGKSSRTGQEVIARMKKNGSARVQNGKLQVKSNGKWVDAKQCDMAHKTDAVAYWNKRGRFSGAKSPTVRAFMLDSSNYKLQPYWVNRSEGASLGQQYLPPVKGK
jgi:RHS repeat-associated protein